MADISDASLDKMVRFCEFQRTTNSSGIGNECTHVVYAALFEVGAMDGMSDVNRRGANTNAMVQTTRTPYHWGRSIAADVTRGGDVVQFDGVVQTTYVYGAGGPWYSDVKKRAPYHTGILEVGALLGDFRLYEAHLTQEGFGHMEVRVNRVFYETYAVMLSKTDLQGTSNLATYINRYAGDPKQLLAMVNFGPLRDSFGTRPLPPARLASLFNSGSPPTPDAAVFFQVNVAGQIRFYQPQVSMRRQRMALPSDRAAEKAALIRRMQTSGRAGIAGYNWDWDFRDQ